MSCLPPAVFTMEPTPAECDSFTTLETVLVWTDFPSTPLSGKTAHEAHPEVVGNVGATTFNASLSGWRIDDRDPNNSKRKRSKGGVVGKAN